MKKCIVVFSLLMVLGFSAMAQAEKLPVCVGFNEFCDQITFTSYNPATGLYTGMDDVCGDPNYTPFPVYFKLAKASWMMLLDFDAIGLPITCTGDHWLGLIQGSGPAGTLNYFYNCVYDSSLPATLAPCTKDGNDKPHMMP